MAEPKPIVTEMIPMVSRITDQKLDGSNYRAWRSNIRHYIRSVDMEDHVTKTAPEGDAQKSWLRDDSRIFLQIKNSIESNIIGMVSHCDSVKEILSYLDFLYSGKDNMNRVFDVCKVLYQPDQGDKSLTDYFMEVKKTCADFEALMPISDDPKVQRTQRDKMFMISFLVGLSSKYDMARDQALASSDVKNLEEAYTRILRIEKPKSMTTDSTSAMVGQSGDYKGYKGNGASSGSGSSNTQGYNSAPRSNPNIVCYYCHNRGHTKKECRKLLRAQQRNPQAYVASAPDDPVEPVMMSAGEFAKFQQYQEALKASSPPAVANIAESGNTSTCLLSSTNRWVIDSGATDHMTGNPTLFSNFLPSSSLPKVTIADGTTSHVLGSGTVDLTDSISLSSVLSLPDFSFNLISVRKLVRDLDCIVSFFPDYCLFQDRVSKRVIGKGHASGGLYVLDQSIPVAVPSVSLTSPFEEHCRLGHPSISALKRLRPQLSFSSLQCESCQFAKFHRTSLYPRVDNRASAPFELVHSDVWGPCPVESKLGFRYFVTFVDDYSRVTWLYLMKNRSELINHFCNFHAEIRTQFNGCLKILRSDNAKEYFSHTLGSYLNTHGILHQSSCVDNPSQNGVAERKNRHLLETARALMFQMKVPKMFWADAVSTACYLINRMPSSVLQGEIPFHNLCPTQSLFSLPPKIFGSICFVRDVRPTLSKLDPKSLKCVFLGYSRLQKGYKCYSPTLDKYFVSRDVTFFEKTPFYGYQTQNLTYQSQGERPDTEDDFLVYTVLTPPVESCSGLPSEPSVAPPITQVYTRRQKQGVPSSDPPVPVEEACPLPTTTSSDDPATSDDLPIALRKGKRSCTYPIASFVSYDNLSPSTYSFVASLDSISVPKTVREALSHSGWCAAMVEEMTALDANGTWELVNLPAEKTAIGCRWVFAVKVNPDGSVARLKARLVAKGYAQTYGVDYDDTFSPVAKMTSVRLFISLASIYDWPLHQLDIKNAFLHGDLQEEVYMEQPPGFVAQGENGKVCRLRKSLYGLKQSPRAWFGKFSQAIEHFGMKKSTSDHSVFFRRSASGIILLIVYVDDIVITGDDTSGIQSLKTFLHGQFSTKDLGLLKYFLGIEVLRSDKGILLSQRKYVLDLLTETGKLGAKPCSTPMLPNTQLTKDGKLLEDPEKYRRLVGKLNYLTVTRPDIAYSVSIMSQYMSCPTVEHWSALDQILGYLKASPGRGVLYKNNGHTNIEGYSDADWAGSKEDRKSTSGYCVFVGGNLVSWKSKKQNVVSRSSAESEYRAMAQSVCELIWLRQLLCELGFEVKTPTKLWCDNQAAIHIASNPVFHERTKHIEVDCHFIREKIQQGLISTGYVKTGEQIGDIFTKALNGARIEYLSNKLGIINIYAPT